MEVHLPEQVSMLFENGEARVSSHGSCGPSTTTATTIGRHRTRSIPNR